ncbi:toxin-antitoxin system YwqK family antitoxin [Mariniradius sediminis]|uniref:Antitoxin component YwqK of the YwqJK toxin-antitoxin module n=1 Tax=Mariniradius sediminis TaxID=2909237 RepID=A0ABS9BTJ4_9BACT|nr:hypothetical protein [Mariniradius sediminis]MCF1751367.1 hypothetical protein [Mariniradius sediminis]
MSRFVLSLAFSLFYLSTVFGQKLTINELTNLGRKKNWEEINQFLMSKGWVYYDSEKGSSQEYSTITWSYNKDSFSDKAQAWFYLFTYEGYPNKISYSFFNQDSYSLIQSNLGPSGFKLVESKIEDNQLISTYRNSSFTLNTSTKKRSDSDWTDRTLTAYTITLIRNEGVYDLNNGRKIDYHYGNIVKAEYTLVNGKLHGEFRFFHENGKLMKSGACINGVEHGIFKEYDENGNLEVEYQMVNGQLDGVVRVFEGKNLLTLTTYKNNIKNGPRAEYSYDEGTGELFLRLIGEYLNNEKNGKWELFAYSEGQEILLTIENYKNGSLNGPFQDVKGDSLILGSHKNGLLDGDYKVYLDHIRFLVGGIIRTDTSKLSLVTEGSFQDGLESGYWRNYGVTGTILSEGAYTQGKKTGEWKYYYERLLDSEGNVRPYSNQLFLVQSYSNGKLNGKSIRYSYLFEEEIDCQQSSEKGGEVSVCKEIRETKVNETSNFIDDKLNGEYELLDSVKNLIVRGVYVDGVKEGEWLHRYTNQDLDGETISYFQKGNYKKDKREGEWIQFMEEGHILETLNYLEGEYHGEHIKWNGFKRPREIIKFDSGSIVELVRFDSLGIEPSRRYEIFNASSEGYHCRLTEYTQGGYVSQVYWSKTESRLDQDWFELTFLLSIDDEIGDGTKGFKDGEFKIMNNANQPILLGGYFKHYKTGKWIQYFYDQGLKMELDYNEGINPRERYYRLDGSAFTGEFFQIDESNNIKEVVKIKGGVRNGITVFVDLNNNKTIRTERYKDGRLN